MKPVRPMRDTVRDALRMLALPSHDAAVEMEMHALGLDAVAAVEPDHRDAADAWWRAVDAVILGSVAAEIFSTRGGVR